MRRTLALALAVICFACSNRKAEQAAMDLQTCKSLQYRDPHAALEACSNAVAADPDSENGKEAKAIASAVTGRLAKQATEASQAVATADARLKELKASDKELNDALKDVDDAIKQQKASGNR